MVLVGHDTAGAVPIFNQRAREGFHGCIFE